MLAGGETLLGATVARVQGVVPPERILVVTAAEQVDEVVRTAPSVPRENIVLEPKARNTAPCIGLGALEVLRRDPAGVMAVLPSDQWIRDAGGFRRAVERALDVARGGAIVTIGIVPSHPETGFGYLELGDETERGARVVERFVEKPDRATAERYVAGERHLWNSGMFFFAARRLVEAVRRHMPELGELLHAIERQPERVGELYPQAPSVSIDYGVMEKLPRGDVFCVPGDFGWNDVGSWSALGELRPADEAGNTLATENPITDRCARQHPLRRRRAARHRRRRRRGPRDRGDRRRGAGDAEIARPAGARRRQSPRNDEPQGVPMSAGGDR